METAFFLLRLYSPSLETIQRSRKKKKKLFQKHVPVPVIQAASDISKELDGSPRLLISLASAVL